MKWTNLLSGTAVVLLLAAATQPAEAGITTLTGDFTSDHCGGGGSAGCLVGQNGNGGSVSVTGSDVALGSTVLGSLTFSVNLANGNQFINSGFQATFGFNLDTSIASITYSLINPAANYTLPNSVGNVQTAGSLMMDGTGEFTYGLEGIGNGGSDPLGSTLNFTIQALGLDLFDLAKNDKGQYAAADIISFTAPGRPRTGGIDVSGGLEINPGCIGCVDVPEPASIAALGGALVALAGVLGWRRRRKADPYTDNALAS